MKQRITSGGIVKNSQGLILVVNQNGRTWSLPKGGVENGEEIIAAAKREIQEESGISDLRLIKSLGQYERCKMTLDGGDDPTEQKIIHMFLFETSQIDLRPSDRANPEARWVAKEDVEGILTHWKDKEFYLKIKDQI